MSAVDARAKCGTPECPCGDPTLCGTVPADPEQVEAFSSKFVDASSDASLLACSASAWEGGKSRCRWCNRELSGKRRRWCSDECAGDFGRNHWWSSASRAAMKRDDRICVRCGAHEGDPRRRPGTRFTVYLEVHHTTPVLGRHSVSGCHHHLDGLETLCVDCHLDEHHGPRPDQLFLDQAIAPAAGRDDGDSSPDLEVPCAP